MEKRTNTEYCAKVLAEKPHILKLIQTVVDAPEGIVTKVTELLLELKKECQKNS